MFCNQCGKKVDLDSAFCNYCGSSTVKAITPDYYVQSTSESKASDLSPGNKQSIDKVRPWVRYWARMVDIILFSIPAGIIIYIIFPELIYEPGGNTLVNLAALFMWVFVEPIFLVTFGTTPGKWLFKITLTPTKADSFTYASAFQRSIKVWFFGLGAGFPIVSIITMVVALSKLNKNEVTSWDAEENIKVSHGKIGALRTIFAILFFITFFMFSIILNDI